MEIKPPTDEEIQAMKDLRAKVEKMAEEGDPVAELLVAALDYTALVHSYAVGLHAVIQAQQALLETHGAILKDDLDKVPMPKCPDDLNYIM